LADPTDSPNPKWGGAIRLIGIPLLDRSACPAIFIHTLMVNAAADSIRVHAC
jgi:hypothetical protein